MNKNYIFPNAKKSKLVMKKHKKTIYLLCEKGGQFADFKKKFEISTDWRKRKAKNKGFLFFFMYFFPKSDEMQVHTSNSKGWRRI